MSREEAYARYLDADGNPKFAPSCVLFFDLLGITAMATSPIALAQLKRLRATLRDAAARAGTDDPEQSHASTWFSDNLMIGTPLMQFQDREGALLFTAVNVSYMQLILLAEGFLGRGGIAFGDHYMDERLVFGPALIDAVQLEKATAYPRVALTPEAAQLARGLAPDSGYGRPEEVPLVQCLLCDDDDGSVFVDALGVWLSEEDDIGVVHYHLPIYRKRIEDALLLMACDAKVLAKWEWMADYFNHALSDAHPDLTGYATAKAPAKHKFSPFHLTVPRW